MRAGRVGTLRRVLGRAPASRRLVISYLFPPAAETSGLVVAKRIHSWGLPVDVIANEAPAGREPDPGAVTVAGPTVGHVVRLKGRRNKLADWQNVERFASRGLRKIRALEAEGRRYGSVYSRSMMPSSHVLAALYKLEHREVPWIAEFSDPLVLDTRGDRRRAPAEGEIADRLRAALREAGVEPPGVDEMFELVEALVYAFADEIVFTNENQRDLMLGLVPHEELRARAARHAIVAAHPAPAPELYVATPVSTGFDGDVVNIGYFGVFYGVRSAAALLAPWTRLDAGERASVRLHLYVPKPDAVREQVSAMGLGDCVEVHPFVPYLEFLNITTQLDWLVVADSAARDHHGANPYLPSKLSDYLGSGTPVWGIVEEGSPMDRIRGLTTTPLGDDEAALALLRRIVRDHVPR